MGDGVETELARVANLESARRRTPRLESAPGTLPGMLIGINHAIEENAHTHTCLRASKRGCGKLETGNCGLLTLERPNAGRRARPRVCQTSEVVRLSRERHQGRCVNNVKRATGLSDGPSG